MAKPLEIVVIALAVNLAMVFLAKHLANTANGRGAIAAMAAQVNGERAAEVVSDGGTIYDSYN